MMPMDTEMGIVCLIPQDGLRDEHLTLIYTQRPTQNTALDQMVRFLSNCYMPIIAQVSGHQDFGDRGEYHVATILSAQMYDIYRFLAPWHMSKWDFNPHMTQVSGYSLRNVGSLVRFDRIGIWDDNVGEQRNYTLGSFAKKTLVS